MQELRILATSGTLVTYRGRPVAWKSKRQPRSTRSTHSAELIALDQSARMALAARYLLEEMNLGSTEPTPVYVDNEALAFTVIAEHMTDANRHMNTKYFAVCDDVAHGGRVAAGLCHGHGHRLRASRPSCASDSMHSSA